MYLSLSSTVSSSHIIWLLSSNSRSFFSTC